MKLKLAVLLLASANLQAAEKFTEVQNLRLVAKYQKAVIANVNLQNAQKVAQDAVNSFNALCEEEVKAAGMAKGTNCQVNIDTQEATAVAPAKKEKAEEKK